MRPHRGSLLIATALCATLALPAQAATEKRPVVVASSGSVTLRVNDEDQDLCIGVRAPDGESNSCAAADAGVATVTDGPASDPRYLGAAVPAAGVSVEVRRAGQLLATAPTVAGTAYTGTRAGTIRFALVALPAKAPTDGLRVRVLDGAGALVAVVAPGGSALVLARRRVLSGHRGTVSWSIVSSETSSLYPSVLDLGRESVSRCIDVNVRGRHSESGSESCASDSPRDDLSNLFGGTSQQASVDDQCSPRFRLVNGLVAATTRSVRIVLGDGSRRAPHLAAVGDGVLSAYALALGSGVAVRGVEIVDGAGATHTAALASAPLAVLCANGPGIGPGSDSAALPLISLDSLPTVTPAGPVATLGGTPAVRVADGPGDSLCVAVGDQPFTALSCGVVSPVLSETLGTLDSYSRPHAFVVVVPAQVATVRILAPDGKATRDIPTVPGTGYAGAYAGHVRFAAALISGFHELARIDLLDASGTLLYRDSDDSSNEEDVGLPRVLGTRRLAGRAGSPSLWQTALRTSGHTIHCLALTSGKRPAAGESCAGIRSDPAILLAASCATRRLTVAVTVAAGSRVVANTGTGTSAPRPIALHGGAGVLTLPSRSPLTSLSIVRRGKTRTVRVAAPPGASQCGWRAGPIPVAPAR